LRAASPAIDAGVKAKSPEEDILPKVKKGMINRIWGLMILRRLMP